MLLVVTAHTMIIVCAFDADSPIMHVVITAVRITSVGMFGSLGRLLCNVNRCGTHNASIAAWRGANRLQANILKACNAKASSKITWLAPRVGRGPITRLELRLRKTRTGGAAWVT